MSLIIENETDEEFSFDYKALANKTVSYALEYKNFPFDAQINLILVTNESIREINSAQRGIDRATDVLSFPMLEYENAGDFESLEPSADCYDPDSGEVLLGDIIISTEKVISQSREYGHSVEREFAFLIAHSMLHLFGYDHENEEDALLMEEEQRKILDNLHIYR